MSPYRVQYTESESDIKNYNFLYKNTKQLNMFSIVLMENFKNPIFQKLKFVFGIMYTFNKSYFTFYFLFWEVSKIQKFQKLKCVFGIMYTFYNSYFYDLNNIVEEF